jgi:hypothetical protein
MLQKLAFLSSCKRLASDDHNSNKTARKTPFPATVETSQRLSGSYGAWPSMALVRVAAVAGVQYCFLILDLYAIFNVFLCYNLLHADFSHGHGWLERIVVV